MAATQYLDEKLDLNGRLAPSRAAATGRERLTRYIEFWGNYIPRIYSVAKALLLAKDTDAAAAAWKNRMDALLDGCSAAVESLHADGALAPEWTIKSATDALWTILLVPNWENLSLECGWSDQFYVERMIGMAERILLKD